MFQFRRGIICSSSWETVESKVSINMIDARLESEAGRVIHSREVTLHLVSFQGNRSGENPGCIIVEEKQLPGWPPVSDGILIFQRLRYGKNKRGSARIEFLI